ncbi:SDR family NAD(P)-dependent oxidoreductase [Dyadobacter sp. CY356]|uniref:SDR family NAD(P)-dependent oxidoreductase n=1 Tax=Dyadobacter sp. CY356 TaxID=2906442 RepID=UPI0038D49CE3
MTGGRGILYAIVKELTEKGARVIITGGRTDAVETAALELDATGFGADQSNKADFEKPVVEVTGRFGKIDIYADPRRNLKDFVHRFDIRKFV